MTAEPAGPRPAGPTPVGLAEIEAAADRLGDRVRRTPVLGLAGGDLGLSCPVTLKLELLQHSGSFKARGAFNRVLAVERPPALVAASGGNHGAAVAYVGRALGLPVEVFVPAVTSRLKRERITGFGAHLVVGGEIYDDAQRAADARAAETGALLVHPYDHELVVAGQGTVGRELDDQVPGLDTVLVAVGGGGLIAGVASWYRGRAKVVSVEPEVIPAMERALVAGEPVEVGVSGVAADSLGAQADRCRPVGLRVALRARGGAGARRRHHRDPAAVVVRAPARGRAGRRGSARRAGVRRLPPGRGRARGRHRLRLQHRPGGAGLLGRPAGPSEPAAERSRHETPRPAGTFVPEVQQADGLGH